MKSLVGIVLGPILAGCVMATTTTSSNSSSSRMTLSPQTSWPVSVSVLFTVLLDRIDRPWDDYESELMAAVDRLALETVALMNNDWTTSTTVGEETPSSTTVVVDPVQVQLPMVLGISKNHDDTADDNNNSTTTTSPSTQCATCRSVYASATLWIDPSRKDPMEVEEAFEGTFHASVRHGYLQEILTGIVAADDTFVARVVVLPSSSPTTDDEDGTGTVVGDDDHVFFGGPPAESNRETPTTDDVQGGLSMLGVLGVLSAALLALGVSMIALWVVRQKRRSARELDGAGHQTHTHRNKARRNRRRRRRGHEVPPVDTDLDLVETFSETGLEWGGTPENAVGAPAPLSNRNRTESDAAGLETMSLEDALAPYALPTQFQMATTPDSFASTNYSTNFSVPTPDSSVGNSAWANIRSNQWPRQK